MKKIIKKTKLLPLSSRHWSNEQADLMSPMLNNQGVGPIASNLFTTLVRYPKLYKRWSVFANHILFKSSLSPRERELAILRIAWLCQAEYEWGQHVLIAQEEGVSRETIANLQKDPASVQWNEQDSSLLFAVDELHQYAGIGDTTWERLKAHFSEKQIMDLIFTVGNYRMLATLMNSINIERDEGVPGF